MKTTKIVTLLLLLISTVFYAQEPKKDKFKALKVAFITKELDLTSAEAEKFWPVYNAFDDKQFEIRFNKMKGIKQKLEKQDINTLTDKEATVLLAQIESAEDELYQNKKKFMQNIKSIISPVKIIKLKKAEDDLNKKLLKQYRDKRDNGPEKP